MAKDALAILERGIVCAHCDEPLVTEENKETEVVIALTTDAWWVTDPDEMMDEKVGDVGINLDYDKILPYHAECYEERSGILWREELVLATGTREQVLSQVGITLEQLWEYIDEAEHQDGYTYWNQFDSTDEVIADMKQYFAGGPPEGGPYRAF